MNIQDIHIISYPAVIFSDPHTNLTNLKKLKGLYPNSQFICLGDFTFLFEKTGFTFNQCSIQYFIDNNIPALEGNHEAFLVAASNDDKFVTQMVIGNPPNFNLSGKHLQFLENLPRGFKIILPNGDNYYAFHNEPKQLWNFPDKINEEYFKSNYIFDERTLGVVCGHLHRNQIDTFPNIKTKRYVVGQLCGKDHHSGENTGRNYLILTEKGLEYKKL